jgi:hypothetical protein
MMGHLEITNSPKQRVHQPSSAQTNYLLKDMTIAPSTT